MGRTKLSIQVYSTSSRALYNVGDILSKETCITYDNQRKNILSWGNKNFESDNEDDIRIDSFTEKLCKLFKKGKDNWNPDDLFSLKAISNFMRLAMEELIEELNEKYGGSIDTLHYIFVAPSEWEDEVREALLRPMFIEADLLSKDDHKDRLLFCSDVQSICYNFMDPYKDRFYFKRGKDTILCRLYPIKETEIMIKLDLISTVNTLFDFNLFLYPKIVRANSLSLTLNDITDGVKGFINTKLPINIQEEIVQIIIDAPYSELWFDMDKENENTYLKKALINDTSKWELNKQQNIFIRSICLFDICHEIAKHKFNSLRYLLLNDRVKNYNFLVFTDEYSSEIYPRQNLLNWTKYILEYNRISFNAKNVVYRRCELERINPGFIIHGASQYGFGSVQDSDIKCKPRIVPVKNSNTSSSIFSNSKPDAIMSIGISLKSTLFSFSFLDQNGFIKEIFNHDSFTTGTSLRSLDSFFHISEEVTLNVKRCFISFADDYLIGNNSALANDRNDILFELMETEIQTIFRKDNDTKDLLISTQQQLYIKAFILLYMIYIKRIISRKLSVNIRSNTDIKIGYSVIIENMLLYHLFGTKEDMKNVLYAIGLIQKKDSSKKLRIITQGEKMLSLIREFLPLQLPLKSFFLLAQLHENYVQLSLNQVVTESSLKENQQTIIVEVEFIYIPNVFDSLCLNMWKNIVEDNSLIQLCIAHQEYNETELLDLFSLENQVEFTKNFKKYLSKNSLDNNSNQKMTEKLTIRLNVSCTCRVCFTVADMMDISFLPFLQDISLLLISSEYFRSQWYTINHLFYSFQFNYNAQLQDAVIKMLKETTEDIMIDQGIDIPYYIIPKSLNQLLEPVLRQQPFSYKDFRVGALNYVYRENYGYGFANFESNRNFVYESKITDTKTLLANDQTVFPFLKKGDEVINGGTDQIVYLNLKNVSGDRDLYIKYYKLKTLEDLSPDGTVHAENVMEKMGGTYVFGGMNAFKIDQYLPIAITTTYLANVASLGFLAKTVGEEWTEDCWYQLAEPMTLSRF